MGSLLFSQGTVLGTITDQKSGEPLAGANILIEGLGIGTTSEIDGSFEVANVSEGIQSVVVSYIGYKSMTQSVSVVSGQPVNINFSLKSSPLALDEVFVTGNAGGVRKREIGNSVGQINMADVDQPVANVEELLSARIPGLNFQNSSGASGAGGVIRLRGNSSVAMSNAPLIYIDGIRVRSDPYPKNVPATGYSGRGHNTLSSPLNDINPNDIERVEVIKGAAATTLYGTEAGGGVIQIFTKRGKAGGGAKWDLQIDQGTSVLPEFGTKARPYFGLGPFVKDGTTKNYSISTIGGGADLRYFVSANWSDNTGVLPDAWDDRLNVRGNFGFSPNDNLQINYNTMVSKSRNQNPPQGNNAHGLTLNAYRGRASYFGTDWSDPKFKEELELLLVYDITSEFTRYTTGGEIIWSPIENFTNTFKLGYDRSHADHRNYRPYGFVRAKYGILADLDWTGELINSEYIGSYDLRLGGDLNVDLSFGGQRTISKDHNITAHGENLPPGDATVAGAASQQAREYRTKIINAGYFGQTVVGFKDRYFLTLGMRADGFSAFGEETGFQNLPKVSGSYILSDESFWPQSSVLGTMKLRAAWGRSGRAPGAFDAVRTWNPVGWGGEVAFFPLNVGNEKLGPEVTTETEFGFDATFFDDKISVEFTSYNQRTKDALFNVSQIPSLGFGGSQLENVGEISNKGIELAVQADILRTSTFSLSGGFTLATNESEVISLGGAAPFSYGGWITEGGSVPGVIGRNITNPNAYADPEFSKDANGNTDSRYMFGPNLPTDVYSGFLELSLPKGIKVFTRGEFMGGHYISDGASSNVARRGAYTVCDEIVVGGKNAYELVTAGTVDGLTAKQRAMCTRSTVGGSGNIFIYPGDFFKLRDFTVSIPVPVKFNNINSMTLKLSAKNAYRWLNDDFPLFDPEMVSGGGRLTGGSTSGYHNVRAISEHIPSTATYTLSLRVSF
jgi:TonB-dependent SusC/RagA subfamily outer membrane receptor